MSKIIIILTLFFNSSIINSQEIIVGKVIDNKTNSVISYVNIGVPNKSVGTVTNSIGRFKLKLTDKINLNDKIVFSCIGFKTQTHIVSNLLNKDNIIELEEEIITLDEVVLVKKRVKIKKLGRKGKGIGLMHWNFYSFQDKDVDDWLSKEVGQKFRIKKDAYLNKLNFNITGNQFKLLKFRLNIYSIKNGIPNELINDRDILFTIPNGYLGWLSVDLKPYDIFLKKELEEVAVTIQWVESQKKDNNSKYFSISAAMGTNNKLFYRDRAMDKWKRKKIKLSFYIETLY